MIEPSFKARADALSVATHIARAPNRENYLKRKKIPADSLAIVYANAVTPFLQTHCIAAAERFADAEISAKFGWKTLDELRNEAYLRLRRELSK